MPTARIADADRLTPAEIKQAWAETVAYLQRMPHQLPEDNVALALDANADALHQIDAVLSQLMIRADWAAMCAMCCPRITDPWWSAECSRQLGLTATRIQPHLAILSGILFQLSQVTDAVMRRCGFVLARSDSRLPQFATRSPVPLRSALLLPHRLMHKLVTLLIWLLRAMDPAWLAATL